ncbi:hypothetical protein BC936DRAFT_142934 [Jimgerdemannia flammicorona]|uniref:Uncharacterized protein n=1 Tax=Jimgerdemannia flammicorona TaxID=994334 RepID=A0A432ZZP2_9FUNG|nr:hypothetical protein BC936DRAFT_142934 [Jimgerdemannia flammicorona]
MARTHSFQLLEDYDITDFVFEYINHTFLLDSSAVSEGGPLGINFDELMEKNYPKLDASSLNIEHLPFLI